MVNGKMKSMAVGVVSYGDMCAAPDKPGYSNFITFFVLFEKFKIFFVFLKNLHKVRFGD
jgi:hypothetical protein